jgi:hypothetical protein
MFRLRDSQAPYIPQHAKYFVEGLQVKNITWIQNESRRNKSNPHNARVFWCGRLGMCGSPRKDAVIIDFNFVGNKWILDRFQIFYEPSKSDVSRGMRDPYEVLQNDYEADETIILPSWDEVLHITLYNTIITQH